MSLKNNGIYPDGKNLPLVDSLTDMLQMQNVY